MQKVKLVIQARTGSSRLPNKVTAELVPGLSLLECLLDRVKHCESITEIIVATSELDRDNSIEAIACKTEVRCFRGSEGDVLSRFMGAVGQDSDSIVVRVCADSPLHDSQVIDACVTKFTELQDSIDYLSNMHPETFPFGMSVEVFSSAVLQRLDSLTERPELREHVTPMAYSRPDLFRTANYAYREDLSFYRFVVDFPEDLTFVRSVYSRLYDQNSVFSWLSVINLLREEPSLTELNATRNERFSSISS